MWAHKLLDQKLYTVALPQLRGLEAVNPGFPGVALNESEALLEMGQLNGARGAADAQVRISACLAGLPGGAIDAYCREEFSPGDAAGCRQVMARVQAAAELQAARVHLEMANVIDPNDRLAAARAELTKGEAAASARGKPVGEAALDAGVEPTEVAPGGDDLRASMTADRGVRRGRGRRRHRRHLRHASIR